MSARRSRIQGKAVTGLLVTCALLGAGLAVTAFFSYRAAEQAARDVLFSRAAEVAAAFLATMRTAHAQQPEDLRRLAEELAGDELGIAVLEADGRVLAASKAYPPQDARWAAGDPTLRRDLRMVGQARRFDDQRELLVYYRPLGRHHHPGRMMPWRRWWRQEARAGNKAVLPPPPWPPGRGPRRLPPRVLRVAVPLSSAAPLLAPARTTMLTAFGGASLLLLVGLLLHAAARRHARMEHALQRKEALSALGEMAAVLAHEIRTPLAAIKGNAQLLGEAAPDDPRAESVVREAGRMERLVNGLLDYARPRAPERRACDPDELAGRAAELTVPRAEQHGVRLISDPARCGSCLEADADLLLQALVNLVQNGIEATAGRDPAAPGDATVTLIVRRTAGNIVFTVLDSGPGFVDPADERVFAPFFTTKARGTGLGLSVARQIALQHGGELRVANRREGGARISLTIPLRAPRDTEQEPR